MKLLRIVFLAATAAMLFPAGFMLMAEHRSGEAIDRIYRDWSRYNQTGQYDSVVISARPVFEEAVSNGDGRLALLASVMIAQAYLFTEMADSTVQWIETAESLGVEDGDLSIKSVFYNTKAISVVKFKLDYSEALRYFLKGYEAATAQGNQDYRVTLLTNIANVFYLRSDTDGMQYARKAMSIVDSCDVSEFSVCLSNLAMSQMCYINADYRASMTYLDTADSLVRNGGYGSLTAFVELLYGDIYSVYGYYDKAESHYRVALEHSYNTEPGTVSRIYLNYGKCYELRDKTDSAVNLYRQGLEVSSRHGNVEFRRELLQRLTDLYCDGDSPEMFKYYYRQYRECLENIADREREFNSLLLSNQRMMHELEMNANELALLEARRRTLVWVFVSLAALMLVASFFLLWRRQKRMYRVLVDQHVHYVQHMEMLQRETTLSDSPSGEKDMAEKELFHKVDLLMTKDKIFRQKDLTLDRLAELTDSNRTYVSKAINHYSGQSFSSYLNMYRVAEATRLISRHGEEMPLKQVADEVGYASISVFYNAFCKETGLPPGRYRKELQNRKTVPDS